MDQVFIEKIKQLTNYSLEFNHNLKNLCANSTNSLVEKFDGVWLRFSCKQFLGHFHARYIRGKMTQADLEFVLLNIQRK